MNGGFLVNPVLAGLKGELMTPLMVSVSVAVPVNRAPMLTEVPLGDGLPSWTGPAQVLAPRLLVRAPSGPVLGACGASTVPVGLKPGPLRTRNSFWTMKPLPWVLVLRVVSS